MSKEYLNIFISTRVQIFNVSIGCKIIELSKGRGNI